MCSTKLIVLHRNKSLLLIFVSKQGKVEMQTHANTVLLAVSAMTQMLICLRYVLFGYIYVKWLMIFFFLFLNCLFHAQKPADLEGTCPFTALGQLCPYGLTCRFLTTHKENLAPQNHPERKNEKNTLSKDIQRVLWKNNYKFPKANAQIKLLGLKVYNFNQCLVVSLISQISSFLYLLIFYSTVTFFCTLGVLWIFSFFLICFFLKSHQLL